MGARRQVVLWALKGTARNSTGKMQLCEKNFGATKIAQHLNEKPGREPMDGEVLVNSKQT